MKIDYSNPKIITRTALLTIVILAVVLSLLTGCSGTYYVVEQPQHTCELTVRGDACLSDHSCCKPRDHSTQVYYHNDLPYWGFYNDYYYYYGIPHIYPWWYYYTLIPHYTYNINTHVYIQLNNTTIVRNPRGPKFNNGKNRTYTPRTSSNKVKSTNRNNVKINTNRNNVKINTNRNNVKVNTNRNNVKVNINRTNINRSNNKRKINTKRPR